MRKLLSLNKIEIDYDFSGASNYLIIVVPNSKDVISYQVQMISNNKTDYFLPVKKVQINNKVQLYYDITNKVTLSQLLKTYKLKKIQLLTIIEGVVAAVNESKDYQLEDKGIVLDKKYIYMESLDYSPCFVYMPFYSESLGLKVISNFINELILDDVLEYDNSGFYNNIINKASEKEITDYQFSKFISALKASIKDDEFLEKDSKPARENRTTIELQRDGTKGRDVVVEREVAIDTSDYSQSSDFEQNKKEEMIQNINLKDSYLLSDEKTEEEINEEIQKLNLLNKINKTSKTEKQESISEKTNTLDKKESISQRMKSMYEKENVIDKPVTNNKLEQENLDNTFETEFIDTESEFYKEREKEINRTIREEPKKPNNKNKKSVGSIIRPKNTEDNITNLPKNDEESSSIVYDKEEIISKTKKGMDLNLIYFISAQILFLAAIAGMTLAKLLTDESGKLRPLNLIIVIIIIIILEFILYKNLLEKDSTIEVTVSKEEIVIPSKEIKNITKQKPKVAKDTEAYLAKKQIEDTVFVGNKKMPYLTYQIDGVQQKIFITKDSFIIGRFVGQVDYVCESNKVGKIHAEIITRDGLYFINDLNSRNGTYINSYRQRIISNIDYPIDNKDIIILADVEFVFNNA